MVAIMWYKDGIWCDSETDTDGDGASDGWEIENGFDPLTYNDKFYVESECTDKDYILIYVIIWMS